MILKNCFLFIWIFFLFGIGFCTELGVLFTKDSISQPWNLRGLNKAIQVNNRILAQINGKPISVMDVMKKMDLLFYRQYPDYAHSVEARYEFYISQWRPILSEMIDRELVLVDAAGKSLVVSSGDVRQEMEELFGPHIMVNLDNIGLEYDEAWNMLLSDITIRRMLHYQVNAKVWQMINPQMLKSAYEDYLKSQEGLDQLRYQMISIRSDSMDKGKVIAYKILDGLRSQTMNLASLKSSGDLFFPEDVSAKVSISQEYTQSIKDLAENVRDCLWAIEVGSWSEPMLIKSRTENKEIWRMYHVAEKVIKIPSAFAEMEQRLKEELFQELSATEMEKYFKKLRAHFEVRKEQIESDIPSDFVPFVLV